VWVKVQILVLVALYVGPIIWFVLRERPTSAVDRLWLVALVAFPYASGLAFAAWKLYKYHRIAYGARRAGEDS